MSQLPLPIDWDSRSPRSAIITGEPNRAALDLLTRPDIWPSHCLLLVGPRKSGRSTIAAQLAGSTGCRIVDDADMADETMLFHAWNGAREAGARLLLVAQDAPPAWQITLPDLRSRLAATGIARILPPDEAMIETLVAEGLAEAGAAYAADVPRYLAQRLPRCYATVDAAIALLNRVSLSAGRRIILADARAALESVDAAVDDPEI